MNRKQLIFRRKKTEIARRKAYHVKFCSELFITIINKKIKDFQRNAPALERIRIGGPMQGGERTTKLYPTCGYRASFEGLRAAGETLPWRVRLVVLVVRHVGGCRRVVGYGGVASQVLWRHRQVRCVLLHHHTSPQRGGGTSTTNGRPETVGPRRGRRSFRTSASRQREEAGIISTVHAAHAGNVGLGTIQPTG